jgi:putative CocE/NonD family hydrolase
LVASSTRRTAAATAPPALRAIAPALTSSQYHEGWTYQGGAFQLGFNLWWSTWILGTGELRRRMADGDPAVAERLGRLVASADRPDGLYARRPLQDLSELADVAPYYREWLAHPEYDAFWRSTAPVVDYQRITAPALNFGGWFDTFLPGTLESFIGMRRSGGSEEARRHQRLVTGPWAHGNPTGSFPEGGFGLASGINGAIDSTGLQLQWFDWLLKGEETALDLERPVRLFVMGPNVWRDEGDWPLPDTDYETWYLHSNGRANGASGDGRLSRSAPSPDEPEDAYLYDPRRPVPTLGGATYLPGLFVSENAGPRDQRTLDARTDILSYTSDPLDESLEVIGPLRVLVHASSSAPDTDFTAKLIVIAPDGGATGVADGILRAAAATRRQGQASCAPTTSTA